MKEWTLRTLITLLQRDFKEGTLEYSRVRQMKAVWNYYD